ncbi:MAG: hypothetical protein LC635_05365 [Pseudonocardiaceae bacterium]|nr:hypothetical protein [Pseudonocardiaceae bacterium]
MRQDGAVPADAQLTDSPGSDFWRNSGGAVLWGGGLLLAGGLFAWWAWRSSRRRWRAPPGPRPALVEDVYSPYIPDTVPPEFYESEPARQTPPPDPAPPTEPMQRPASATESPPAEASDPDEPTAGRRESTSDRPAERNAPPDQKDKE